MSLFRKFPSATYDFTGSSSKQNIVDIFRNLTLSDNASDALSIYQTYTIRDGDRPDVVSEILYGDSTYYWTFFYVNDSLREGLAAWYKSHAEFEKYLELTYDSKSILEFKTQILAGTVQHFSSGSAYNYINALQSYPFKTDGYVKGYNSDDLLLAEGVFQSFSPDTNQLPVHSVEGEFSTTQKIYVEATSDAALLEWFIKYRPLDYDVIYNRYSNPVLVDAGDGSTPYYTYTPDAEAIMTAVKNTPFSCHRAHVTARNAPHHFEDSQGEIINAFLQGSSDREETYYSIVTNYEYETALNDSRRNIRVIAPNAVLSFSDSFEELINA